jgi:putative transposase
VPDSNVIKLAQPGVFTDSLTEILRSGARALLTQAVEAEVAEFLAKHADLKTETGHQRVVRHGHLPEREIVTGIGPVAVRQPRVRDRASGDGERIRYSPAIVPRYARRSRSLEVLIPILYLKGISTGDFEEVLAALVGDAPGLSASTIVRLKEVWTEEHARWQKRDLSAKRYVYCWPMASIWRPGSSTRRSASWSSSARRLRARRNSSASPTACARAHNRGVICCSI